MPRKISIHSTARVETPSSPEWRPHPGNFNPLHREGGDVDLQDADFAEKYISIHSTARVETEGWAYGCCSHLYFNPLHREGGDDLTETDMHWWKYFNPLHREGGDI